MLSEKGDGRYKAGTGHPPWIKYIGLSIQDVGLDKVLKKSLSKSLSKSPSYNAVLYIYLLMANLNNYLSQIQVSLRAFHLFDYRSSCLRE